ncbi:MAG: hypothetical protein LBR38_00560 [Synergistaceae bacterium]|jgi:hypothetical protein|nr:hypothetical protein [Synergistaceae bacterium]
MCSTRAFVAAAACLVFLYSMPSGEFTYGDPLSKVCQNAALLGYDLKVVPTEPSAIDESCALAVTKGGRSICVLIFDRSLKLMSVERPAPSAKKNKKK